MRPALGNGFTQGHGPFTLSPLAPVKVYSKVYRLDLMMTKGKYFSRLEEGHKGSEHCA